MTAPESLPAAAVLATETQSWGHTEPQASALPRGPPEPPTVPTRCPTPMCRGVPGSVAPMCLSADHTPFVPRGFRGNLFTRTLSDIVSKEDFVLDSEYLITLLVIVPK